jgi:hypothetical protein
MDSPPFEAGAVIDTVAVVVAPTATVPVAARGAVGAEYVIPKATTAVTVSVTPATTAVAVIV